MKEKALQKVDLRTQVYLHRMFFVLWPGKDVVFSTTVSRDVSLLVPVPGDRVTWQGVDYRVLTRHLGYEEPCWQYQVDLVEGPQ